jgi:hypothetical protein
LGAIDRSVALVIIGAIAVALFDTAIGATLGDGTFSVATSTIVFVDGYTFAAATQFVLTAVVI